MGGFFFLCCNIICNQKYLIWCYHSFPYFLRVAALVFWSWLVSIVIYPVIQPPDDTWVSSKSSLVSVLFSPRFLSFLLYFFFFLEPHLICSRSHSFFPSQFSHLSSSINLLLSHSPFSKAYNSIACSTTGFKNSLSSFALLKFRFCYFSKECMLPCLYSSHSLHLWHKLSLLQHHLCTEYACDNSFLRAGWSFPSLNLQHPA